MSDSASTNEELKNELDIVFRAVWTQGLIDNMPDMEGRTDLVGKPIFYDSVGNFDVDMPSRMLGVGAEVIRVSHDNWLAAGNKPPSQIVASAAPAPARSMAPPGAALLEPVPVEASGGSSTIRDATTHYQEVAQLNQARNSYERTMDGGQGVGQNDDMMMMMFRELIRGNSKSGADSDSLVMLKLLETQERSSERSRQDQAMMMNAMNANNTQMLGLVMDSMRQGGSQSQTDQTLISMALEGLKTGPSGPEESVLDSLIRSGQLADITGSIAGGLKSVLAARSPPVGGPPSYASQSMYSPEPVEPSFQPQEPEPQQFQQPEPMPEISFEDKCRAVMQQIHSTLPEQWQANELFIEILKRSTERSVSRAEEMYPTSIENQMQRAIMELLIVVNLRLLGTSIQNVKKGIVSIEAAGNFMRGHELFPVFASEDYESLMEIITSYIDCDPPGQKNIGFDIEFLAEPSNRQVIEAILAAAKGE